MNCRLAWRPAAFKKTQNIIINNGLFKHKLSQTSDKNRRNREATKSSCARGASAGLAMSGEWKPAASPKTSCMVNWQTAHDRLDAHACASKTSAKKDMKLCSINISSWESCAEDRLAWRLAIRQGVQKVTRNTALAQKRAKRKERQRQPQQSSPFTCSRDCQSPGELYRHSRKCR